MFGFKKKDSVCGMREEKGKGFEKNGEWFCSQECLKKYEEAMKKEEKKAKKGCCH